jgi:hypothetical protein
MAVVGQVPRPVVPVRAVIPSYSYSYSYSNGAGDRFDHRTGRSLLTDGVTQESIEYEYEYEYEYRDAEYE